MGSLCLLPLLVVAQINEVVTRGSGVRRLVLVDWGALGTGVVRRGR